jgi:hypothetical protein
MKWYRSVKSAQRGSKDQFAAMYIAPLKTNSCSVELVDRCQCFCLKLPNTSKFIDGKPRSIFSGPNAVTERNVGVYLNSSLDKNGDSLGSHNCGREWDPAWKTYAT